MIRITDKAVATARQAFHKSVIMPGTRPQDWMRAALEAALPHLEGATPAIDRDAIAAELEKHGVLLFEPQPQCRCGHVYDPLPTGGVAWDMQNKHRADAVLALIGGAS